ncbi:MAG: hypothetical protein R3C27_12295 [Hyphomonadaceae bacterium]
MLRFVGVFAVFWMLGVTAGLGQEPDIVVHGDRLDEIASQFTTEVAAPSMREDQLARWDERVCVGIVGLAPEQGQGIVDRISTRAAEVGLRVGAPGCRANIMLIFTTDPEVVARNIVDERRDLLGYYAHDALSTGGREGLEAFVTTPRPIRWWQVARNVTADGQVLDNPYTTPSASGREAAAANAAAAAGEPPVGIGAFDGIQAVRSTGSRTRRATRQDLSYILIIVDARQVSDFPFSAWTDYVAMVSLAQINPDAEPSAAPSILNLFSSDVENTPMGMTAWDEAYLRGLYRATREATNARAQQREISRTIVTTVAADRPQ